MHNSKMKVAFLDRDGVINEEINYLHKIKDFKYTENCVSGLKKLKKLGFELIIVTNQAGLAKGIFNESDFNQLSKWLIKDLASNGIKILDYVFCPHHPDGIIKKYSINCDCRKPNPGMILSSAQKHKISLKTSILIGDKLSDIQAAKNAGLNNYFLVNSGHPLKKDDSLIAPIYSILHELASSLENKPESINKYIL